MSIRRRLSGVIAAAAVTLTLVFSPHSLAPAEAAPVTGFKPGNIILNENFYQGGALNQTQVQNFLNARVTNPTSQSLRNYKVTTKSKASNSYCKAYRGESNESAARIITKVGQACGISQRAILVILQKETGLVTYRSPEKWRYDRAMGFACPDTGPGNTANCDTSYYGFFNQVYNGVRQLKRYGIDKGFSWFPVGKKSNIQYHPNKSCGTQSVTITNKATAALYYYTPYVPNKAALDAGFGTGNSCSSYGNRNFYSYYKSWFGDPLLDPRDYVGRVL